MTGWPNVPFNISSNVTNFTCTVKHFLDKTNTFGKMTLGSGHHTPEYQIVMEIKHWFQILSELSIRILKNNHAIKPFLTISALFIRINFFFAWMLKKIFGAHTDFFLFFISYEEVMTYSKRIEMINFF